MDLTMNGSVLIVEADAPRADALVSALLERGFAARAVASMRDAFAVTNDEDAPPIDVILLDPDADGVPPLSELVSRLPDLSVILSGSGGARRAVDAIRAGAADYVEKPAADAELLHAIEKAVATRSSAASDVPAIDAPAFGLIGDAKPMRHVLDVVRRVAKGTATVLVRGESGTGKELVARAIHRESPRADEPFVKVHCAGIPESLLESELFGYERGAFTGAVSRKPGRVELAEGGTLFLDEIGDVSPAVQVKLLRLLQDRQYERLGGTQTLDAHVRFVAATHRDLEHMLKRGEFREDLFYRLNVVPVWLPPLRARRQDVKLLATHFCEAFARQHGKAVTLTADALTALAAERWPGNVRQLHNFVERLVVMSESDTIDANDVRQELAPPATFATMQTGATKAPEASLDAGSLSTVMPLDEALRDAERKAIERALRHAKGNRVLAARLLGIGRATLYKKLALLGLVR